MTSPAERPYGDRGKYQGQRGPTPSRFYEDFQREAESSGKVDQREDEGSLPKDQAPR